MSNKHTIRVVELFAGVGGFRIGLEGASDAYETIWNNQWEPSTQHQDASLVYQARFGRKGHSNKDINLVPTTDIPDHDLLVGGFPCQDYSVAATLSKSGGIEGKKGVLWWQIYRILNEKGENRPQYIFFENVDRLLNSPATQRGRDFAIILAILLNGELSTQPITECHSEGAEHTLSAIRKTQSSHKRLSRWPIGWSSMG